MAKNDEADRNFIARVLQGIDLSREKVEVKVDIEECSTFSSSSNIVSSTYSSNVSIDVQKEKFLAKSWGHDPIHGLIRNLKEESSASADERERQRKLRSYIEKLLRMKRQEIADLSVTTTTSDSSTMSGEVSSTTSTTPSKSSPTSKDSTETTSKDTSNSTNVSTVESSRSLSSNTSVEQSGKRGFTSSTPSSILSSSENSGNSRGSGPKTVRFQLSTASGRDTQDGSFLSKQDQEVKITL